MSAQVDLKIRKVFSNPREALEGRWPCRRKMDPRLEGYVKSIVDEVKRRGDLAIMDFTKKFDGVELTPGGIRVSKDDIREAYEKVDGRQVTAIESVKARIEAVERRILESANLSIEFDGLVIRNRTKPLKSVGCYIPGGGASYPSTLVMAVTPAKVAGVPHILVCSPPGIDGEVSPLTLVAADLCGVDEVYRVGGAQAIAAMAYGTESIRRVDKIVGPGNRYVTAAKVIVSKDVAIDVPAGPSEVMILADDLADPEIVALDMISQAEHGADSIAILVTTSRELVDKVCKRLESFVQGIPRSSIVAESLSKNGLIYVCENLDEGISFVNAFAPEHLEIILPEPLKVAEGVTSAGLILIGSDTPVSASDYYLGTNHILPTGGFGKIYSGLSVLDFVRRYHTVECSKDGLRDVMGIVRTLALAEGLPNHASAVEARFRRGV